MRCLLDINVWLALSISAHTRHRKATDWFDASPGNTLYFCRYTQQGTLRLLTTKTVASLYGRAPLTNRAALSAMSVLLDHERIQFAEEPSGLYPKWCTYADASTASPKLWMDAYLAAFAKVGGYSVITTDRAFKQYSGLSAIIL